VSAGIISFSSMKTSVITKKPTGLQRAGYPVFITKRIIKEALNNSSMNYQSTNKIKCDFILFFIFNGLSATENGNTSMCCGNSDNQSFLNKQGAGCV
jgi:hypothetical protein